MSNQLNVATATLATYEYMDLKGDDKMSWENYTLMKCKKCGKVYEVEDSTLIMNQTEYNK